MLSRHLVHGLTVAVAAWFVVFGPSQASAQSDYYREDRRAFVVYGHVGAFGPLTHLDYNDDVQFKIGFSAGGGAAYRIDRHLAVRSTLTFIRAELDDTGFVRSPLAGGKYNRYVFDADLQFRYPIRDGMTPYVFLGGGTLTVQRDTVRERASFTKGALKVGGGMSYQVPHTDVGLYLQGTGWIYEWDRYGFDGMQFDTTLTAGIAYRFRL